VTLTFTPTLTITPTITAINTYVKPGYLLTVKVYNEAGEVVKTIITVSMDYVLTGIITSTGGNTANAFSSDKILTITIPGAGPGGTDIVTSWDGTTDGGQPAASGTYYISAAETDTFGQVMNVTKDITLIKNSTYVQLNIFNSAGELVRTITDVNFVFPPNFLSGPDGLGIKLDVPQLITTKQANSSPVQIKFGAASADIMLWDGKNAEGLSVSSGVYEMQLVVKTETLTEIVATKSVTVLENNDVFIGNIKTVPNPYNGSTDGIQLIWTANETGKMTISIYNIYGELIRNINAALESGAVSWDVKTAGGNQASNGLYIAVLQGISESGNVARMMVKIAVNRRSAGQY
jgi:flagellar hook assembly protein FlgD